MLCLPFPLRNFLFGLDLRVLEYMWHILPIG
jgi:hypothetical protein